MPRLPWRSLLLWSLLGTLLSGVFVLNDLRSTSSVLGTLVDTSPEDPAARVLGDELGPDAVRAGGRHDGAYFYVVARNPFAPTTAATMLDGPRYRLQRIGYPLAAWALHPTGGGPGLMWTMFVVGLLSVFGGAMAMGALSATWRGPPWVAVVFPLLYGSIVSLRISVPDPMTLALAVGAIVVYERHVATGSGRWWRDPWCVLVLFLAVAAVLTRETTWLVLLGFGLATRTRRVLPLVVVPALFAAAWGVLLVRLVPAGEHAEAFTVPFSQLRRTLELWSSIDEPMSYLNIGAAVGLAAYALLKRGLRHPLSWVVIIQLAVLPVLTVSVLVPERSASRQVMPLFVASVVMLVTPRARGARVQRAAGEPDVTRAAAPPQV